MLNRRARKTMTIAVAFGLASCLTPAEASWRDKFLRKAEPFDVTRVLLERDPTTMLNELPQDMRARIEDRFQSLLERDSAKAAQRNKTDLYPNPNIQAYVNRLGQSLIPPEASKDIYLNFRVIEDPMPYADAQTTGTVYLSSGLISLLDNESQLAFILMHEAAHVVLSHHLHQFIEDERGPERGLALKVLGLVAGAVVGGVTGGSEGAAKAATVGAGLGTLVALYQGQQFMNEIELESDQFAVEVLLAHGFDARQAPQVMTKIGEIIRRSGPLVDMAFGNASNLGPRAARATDLLAGLYNPSVDRILTGDGFRMSSPRYSQLMSEIKRDNGLLALKGELFAIARSNLEEAAAVRTDDPLTMYGLGMLYRTVGRSREDQAKASSYLKSAMTFDEVRNRFPEAHLQYAVELLSREDPRLYPEIQSALKTYVALYQRKTGGSLPREMNFIYDYLDLTGDRAWVAYEVQNINAQPPYQLTSGEAASTAEASQKKPSIQK